MITKIDRETLNRADEAAAALKAQLLERVIGQTREGWKCGCGQCGCGRAEAVGIRYNGPDSQYSDMIGLFHHWSVLMREIGSNPSNGYSYSCCITDFIPASELYPLFRSVFGPIGVPVDHPHAQAQSDNSSIFGNSHNRVFTPSGRTVVVIEGEPVFVRPTGDLSKAVFEAAEIRVDSDLPGYTEKGPLSACNVDPFGVHYGRCPTHGLDCGQRYFAGARGVLDQSTFYLNVDRGHVPVARLVAFNATTGAHTYELDESAEVFEPER